MNSFNNIYTSKEVLVDMIEWEICEKTDFCEPPNKIFSILKYWKRPLTTKKSKIEYGYENFENFTILESP